MVAGQILPKLAVSLELGSQFTILFTALQDEAVQDELEVSLNALLETLGIPAQASVSLHRLSPRPGDNRALRLWIDGREVFYPEDLLKQARDYIFRDAVSDKPEVGLSRAYALLAIQGIFYQAPEFWMGPEGAEAYGQRLPAPQEGEPPNWPPSPETLLPILRSVLAMGISLRDHQVVADILAAGFQSSKSQADISEDLLSNLRPPILEVRMNPAYLREITITSLEEERGIFQQVRNQLFIDLGLVNPPFRLVADPELPPAWIRFQLNDILTLPSRGLDIGTIAVSNPDEDLNIQGAQARVHPAYGSPVMWLEGEAADKVPQERFTWSPLEYAGLILLGELRRRGAILINRNVIDEQLRLLVDTHPDLVATVQQRYSTAQLTRLMRAMAAEGLSIQDFRLILEELLDFNYVVVPHPERYIILDERFPIKSQPDQEWLQDPVNLVAFIRMGLKPQITYHLTAGQADIPVFLIGPDIETQIMAAVGSSSDFPTEDLQSRVLWACRRLLDSDPFKYSRTPLITTTEIRPHLRALLAPEFPQLPVVAYQEFTPDTQLNQLGRISLEDYPAEAS